MMNFLMKKMIKRQMKGVPEDQQEKILAIVEKNPEFFMKISKEVEEKTKQGMDQQTASMQVMMAHKDEIAKLMQ